MCQSLWPCPCISFRQVWVQILDHIHGTVLKILMIFACTIFFPKRKQILSTLLSCCINIILCFRLGVHQWRKSKWLVVSSVESYRDSRAFMFMWINAICVSSLQRLLQLVHIHWSVRLEDTYSSNAIYSYPFLCLQYFNCPQDIHAQLLEHSVNGAALASMT